MIYLDYAATAPLRPTIAQAVGELCQQTLGNPSSLHRAGRQARFYLEEARERCAMALGAKVEEIVFCSGATEADNLAILGALAHPDAGHRGLATSAIEHAAVFETAHKVRHALGQPVSWLGVSSAGQVDTESLETVLRGQQGQLVSVMSTNNEVGSRQPLARVAELCRQYSSLLHVDAVQDPRGAKALIVSGQADLLTVSGHKMGGLPGGLLYVRQGVPLSPQILGGAQEDGRRAGTSEVLRAVSLATALAETLEESPAPVRQARDLIEQRLEKVPGALRLGPSDNAQRADHISSWLFGQLSAEPILAQLDMSGVCASSGSACSSHAVEPSRVVKAMGWGSRAMGLVRFSCGWNTSLEEARRAAEIVEETVTRMMARAKEKANR
jgi:cysteine desulfurase